MSKAIIVHLKNKYPDCRVYASESVISVCRGDDEILKLQKAAHGAFEDVSEENGLDEKFDLSEIPKQSRLYKLNKDGKIGKDDLHEERKPIAQALLKKFGKIPSIKELVASKDENYHVRDDKYSVKEEVDVKGE